jgi:predicted nucleic acid-binding protein
MLTVLTQMQAFISVNRSEHLPTSAGGRLPQPGRAVEVGRPWTASAAWNFVAALLASPGLAVLVPTQRHADVAEEVILELPHLAGNLLHDARTAILMREHGIVRICTRDTDFNQFPFLEVIDPLRA